MFLVLKKFNNFNILLKLFTIFNKLDKKNYLNSYFNLNKF